MTKVERCKKCGGEANVFGFGSAKSIFDGDVETIFYTDIDGYYVECKECGKCTQAYESADLAIEDWNNSKSLLDETKELLVKLSQESTFTNDEKVRKLYDEAFDVISNLIRDKGEN